MNEKEGFNGKIAMVQPIVRGLTDMINEQEGLYTLYLRGSENGEAVKEKSPFKMTFVSSCSNGRGSDIPSISTWDYNNKPDVVYGISKTQYEPGAAEILENTFVSMLKELKNAK